MRQGGIHIEIRGTVQGVGYRPWVYRQAQQIGIAGRVWNHSRGVAVEAFGTRESIDAFVDRLRTAAPPAALVRSVVCSPIPSAAISSFTIVESAISSEPIVSIPADIATCDECIDELFDPGDRRYLYPFINCTNCGPRFSIVTDGPYDRVRTSMAAFTMCDACRAEYESPESRRFHAEPNACGDCGPQLTALSPRGRPIETHNPIAFAARAIRAGLIVAVKGVGGVHLACDATSAAAVRRLRERKHRDTKPFAVMVRDLQQAEALAILGDAERTLLLSPERPIVLAPGVDEPLVGLFLPYSPVHHLLLRATEVPLVMTSGNGSDEPMVTTDAAALQELADIADVFLLHDRDIVTRADDSVARVIGGEPVLLRRGRGWVPRAIEASTNFDEPVLACGAQLKNTFCIASGSSAFLGPHIGDLESFETLKVYEVAVERMKRLIGVTPAVIAHDLHPDYISTRYAQSLEGVRTIAVQHHHAHIASVMAEHGLDGPVLGIAYDGTGFGTDGTSWGGEVLFARYEGYERFATFRPIDLAGGDQAIREPWRIALALLDDAYDRTPPLHRLALFEDIPRKAIDAVRRMIALRLNVAPARGVGRHFDALGALALVRPQSRYEGEMPYRFSLIADPAERGSYPIALRGAVVPWEADTRPTVRAAVRDLIDGVSAATISARFHNTIAEATIRLARSALAVRGAMPIALSGGCFQNARLAEAVMDGLRPHAPVFMNRKVPPGDGGVALGQAFVAGALLRVGVSIERGATCV